MLGPVRGENDQRSFRPEDLLTAERRWKDLPHRERKEVLRLSREGRVHPDPRVEEIAFRWATAKVHAGENNVLAKPIVAIPMALAGLLLGGSGAIVQYWKLLRAARRVVEVTNKARQSPIQPGGRAGSGAARG